MDDDRSYEQEQQALADYHDGRVQTPEQIEHEALCARIAALEAENEVLRAKVEELRASARLNNEMRTSD